MSLNLARPVGVLLVALMTSACGTNAAIQTASQVPTAGVLAQGFDVARAVGGALGVAEDGEIEKAKGILRMLYKNFKIRTSADYEDFVLITRAQRQLVHSAAAHTENWFLLAMIQAEEAKKIYHQSNIHLKTLGHPSGSHKEWAYSDVMVLVNEAAEALSDRFPTAPPEVIAKMGPKYEPDHYPYITSVIQLMDTAAKLVRTEDDVKALQAAVKAAVDRARDKGMPPKLLAQLEGWQGTLNGLKPRKPIRKGVD